MHQQVVTSDVLSITKFVQASPQAFESATAHGTLLGYLVITFHINIKLRFATPKMSHETKCLMGHFVSWDIISAPLYFHTTNCSIFTIFKWISYKIVFGCSSSVKTPPALIKDSSFIDGLPLLTICGY
mgnify:CR=1 FL=1